MDATFEECVLSRAVTQLESAAAMMDTLKPSLDKPLHRMASYERAQSFNLRRHRVCVL